MTISSCTPEGHSAKCPICGNVTKIDVSTVPTRDAPCPSCGHLLFFRNFDWDDVQHLIDEWGRRRRQHDPVCTPAAQTEVAQPEPVGSTVALGLHPLDDPNEVRKAEDLFWQDSD